MLDRKSLKVRVGFALLAVALLIWAFAAAITVWVTLEETAEVLDGQLLQVARLVATLPAADFEEYDHQLNRPGPPQSPYEPGIGFQVWSRDGRNLYSSMDLPEIQRPDALLLNRHRLLDVQGREWRLIAVDNPRTGHTVQVGAYRELGWWFAVHVLDKFARSALLVVPFILLSVALAVRQALRPIEALRCAVSSRAVDKNEPIAMDNVPTEVAGLANAINGLAARYGELLGAVRRFGEDAAHELRTPIASIRAHAQVALGEAQDDWLRKPLKQIEMESAHLTLLLDQLLALGKLDHAEAELMRADVDLGTFIGTLAARAGVGNVSLPDRPYPLSVMPDLLEVAFGNLVANARKHGGSKLRVEVFANAKTAGFAIEDDGPGVPPESRQRIFDSFYRLPATRAPGSGLGLSIVQRIVAIHVGRVWVEDARTLKGARFVVAFG
jgi:two-component system sensor histidine kinase QseC